MVEQHQIRTQIPVQRHGRRARRGPVHGEGLTRNVRRAYPEVEVVIASRPAPAGSSDHRSVSQTATPRPWEVVGVPAEGALRKPWAKVVSRVRLGLLTVFGPAMLDNEHDPVVQLKREHQRKQFGSQRSG